MIEIYYRYEFNFDLNIPDFLEYRVVGRTRCGVWLSCLLWTNFDKKKRFVLEKTGYKETPTKKRFAYPTKAEAYEAFKIRKYRHLAILRNQLEMTEHASAIMEKFDINIYPLTQTDIVPILPFLDF